MSSVDIREPPFVFGEMTPGDLVGVVVVHEDPEPVRPEGRLEVHLLRAIVPQKSAALFVEFFVVHRDVVVRDLALGQDPVEQVDEVLEGIDLLPALGIPERLLEGEHVLERPGFGALPHGGDPAPVVLLILERRRRDDPRRPGTGPPVKAPR
jgi:hypothetical protein